MLLALSSALLATSSLANSEQLPSVVALFGDSISVGFSTIDFNVRDGGGLENFGAPATELDSILEESSRSSIVVNVGFGGTPSGPSSNPDQTNASINGVSRADDDLDSVRDFFPGREYYALILYGTNDLAFGVSPSDTFFNISLIIQSARRQGYIPIVGSIPVNTVFNVSSYNQQIFNAAVAEGADFVNINSAISFDMLADGVHPTPEGYRLIAQKWFDDYLEDNISIDGTGNPIITPVINLLLE